MKKYEVGQKRAVKELKKSHSVKKLMKIVQDDNFENDYDKY